MRIFTLTGLAPEITQRFTPALHFPDASYEIALFHLHSQNTIMNVREGCNMLHYSDDGKTEYTLTLPSGTHTVQDIHLYIYYHLSDNPKFKEAFRTGSHFFELHSNPPTHGCYVITSFDLDFSKSNSVGSLLGFSERVKRSSALSKEVVKSTKVVTIMNDFHVYVSCNIAEGSTINNRQSHVIHQFHMGMQGPSAVVIERPSQPVFHSITCRKTDDITIRLEDAQGRLIPMKDGTTLGCTLILRRKNEGSSI